MIGPKQSPDPKANKAQASQQPKPIGAIQKQAYKLVSRADQILLSGFLDLEKEEDEITNSEGEGLKKEQEGCFGGVTCQNHGQAYFMNKQKIENGD